MIMMGKKRRAALLLLAIFIAILSGCGSDSGSHNSASQETANSADSAMPSGAPAEEANMDSGGAGEKSSSDADSNISFQNAPVQKRMVIYNATISLTIKDYQESQTAITRDLENRGGYIVESQSYSNQQDEKSGRLVVKVPQPQFNSFMEALETMSLKVNDRNVTGTDVTEEFVDLESRLKSKLTVESRLLSFMEKATVTEDLLKISNDLAVVQEEIERIRGRMNYLKNNTDFSSVTIHMSEQNIAVPQLQAQEELNTWLNAKKMFMETINVLMTIASKIIVFLIGFSPVLLGAGLIGAAVYVFKKKREKNDIPG